jgi:UDP-N-acetylmuramate--alanine ligase
VLSLGSEAELAAVVAEEAKPGDLVVCLGAGSITQWAYALPDQLTALLTPQKSAPGDAA